MIQVEKSLWKKFGDGKMSKRHIENCITFTVVSRKGDRIYTQVKRMGCSVDWDRAFFTMSDVSRTSYYIILQYFVYYSN